MIQKYKNLDELYVDTLRSLYRDYTFRNQPRGAWERETVGFSATIENPTDRFCYNRLRKQNIVFNYAEVLWYLSGQNDLEFISYFAPRMTRFSADGKTLPGTGYGPRIRNFRASGIDQIRRAVDILRNDDPDSKRVFIQIFDASEDIYKENIDVSCTIGLQLLRREGKLHMVAYMRANDAFVGMLSDVFSFTFLQEYIASLIDCEVGTYTHFVGSIHIYENNLETIHNFLQISNKTQHEILSVPRMPSNSEFADIQAVLNAEREIRSRRMTFEQVNDLNIHKYWKDILFLFVIYRKVQDGEPFTDKLISVLHPLHRTFVIEKWAETGRQTSMLSN